MYPEYLYFPPLLIQLRDQYLTVYNALCTGQLHSGQWNSISLVFKIPIAFQCMFSGPMEFHHTYIFIDWNLSEDLGEPARDFQIPLSVQLLFLWSNSLQILATLASLRICFYVLNSARLQGSIWAPSPGCVACKLSQGSNPILGFPCLFPFSWGITVLCCLLYNIWNISCFINFCLLFQFMVGGLFPQPLTPMGQRPFNNSTDYFICDFSIFPCHFHQGFINLIIIFKESTFS